MYVVYEAITINSGTNFVAFFIKIQTDFSYILNEIFNEPNTWTSLDLYGVVVVFLGILK